MTASSSTLIVHLGGVRRTRDDLAALATPLPTRTWRPVPHADLVAELVRGLERQGITVARDDYCTMGRDDARLLGTMDLKIPGLDAPDFGMALGLRGSNDKSMAIQVVAAARVFVCDNMCFSGSNGAVFLKRKHTSRIDLAAIVPPAVEQFLDRAGTFRLDLDRMRDTPLSDGRAKEIVHDAFAGPAPVAPLRLFPAVSRLYFDDHEQRDRFPDRSLWSLNNAMTEAVKVLRPGPQHHAGQRIGRYFGRVLRRVRPASGEPIVIDGIELD